MSDDLKNSGARDRERINVHEAHELVYWTGALNVTPEALKAAVKAVGVMAKDAREYLSKHK